MKTKKLRMTLLGILAAGLLLIGTGAGVSVFEFSSFTYGGEIIPGSHSQVHTEELALDASTGSLRIEPWFASACREAPTVELIRDPAQAPGTVKVETDYTSVPGISLCYNSYESETVTYLSAYYRQSGFASLLAYKDQLLQDLAERTVRDYLPLHIARQSFTVNPNDWEEVFSPGQLLTEKEPAD